MEPLKVDVGQTSTDDFMTFWRRATSPIPLLLNYLKRKYLTLKEKMLNWASLNVRNLFKYFLPSREEDKGYL